MYSYKCIVRRVVDGDTIDVDIDLGFGIWLNSQRVRLAEFDCAETRTKNLIEKAVGLYTKDLVEVLFPVGREATLISKKFQKGKYGRVIGDIEGWSNMLQSNDFVVKEDTPQAEKDVHWNRIYLELVEEGTISEV